MKPTRFVTTAIMLLGMVAMAFAAGTPSGTTISNQATGTYNDANGNALSSVSSNTVTTTVSQVAGISAGNDQAQSMSAMSSILYDVTIENTGNGTDTLALSAGASGGQANTYTYEIYHDIDNSGTINGSDSIVTTTSTLAADATFDLVVKVTDTTSTGAPNGDEIAVTVTAVSGYNGSVSDAVVLTTTIQAASVTAVVSVVDDGNPQPGDVLTYAVCIKNTGTEDAYNLVFTNLIPTNTTYSAGSIREGTSGWASGSLVTDAGGDDTGDYNVTTASTITDSIGTLTAGDSICVYYKVTIDEGLAEGSSITNEPSITYENSGGNPYPTVSPTDGGGGDVTVQQTYAVTLTATGSTTFTGDPSDSVFYAFTVTNDGNGSDNFNLSDTSDYVVWTYYIDSNQDGSLSTAELGASAVTATGSLAQSGVAYIVAVGVIPAGTADAEVDNSEFTATSQGNSGATDTGTATTTCTAPDLTLTKSVDNATGAPGDTLTYTIIIANSGTGDATTVVVTDVIPTNTTYVSESMTIDAGGVDDASNSDGGTLSGGSVVFDFATLASGASHTVTFQVTID